MDCTYIIEPAADCFIGIYQSVRTVRSVQAGLRRGDAFQDCGSCRFRSFIALLLEIIFTAYVGRHGTVLFYGNSFAFQRKCKFHRLFINFKFGFAGAVIFYQENTGYVVIIGTIFGFAAAHGFELEQEQIFFHGFYKEKTVTVLGALFPNVKAFRLFPFIGAFGQGNCGNSQR